MSDSSVNGNGPGEASEEIETLTRMGDCTPEDGEAVVRLLYGFTPDDAADVKTYQQLIGQLGHAKLAIRHLAAIGLWELAPREAEKLAFDAAGDSAERQPVVEAWARLLADKRLPPRTN